MKIIFLNVFLLLLISCNIMAQSNASQDDKVIRTKFSVHLLTYDTVSHFESAKAEAIFKLIYYSFEENLLIPSLELTDLPEYDKSKILMFINQLEEINQNPPSWDVLIDMEKKYLLWKDKAIRKKSKYKF